MRVDENLKCRSKLDLNVNNSVFCIFLWVILILSCGKVWNKSFPLI